MGMKGRRVGESSHNRLRPTAGSLTTARLLTRSASVLRTLSGEAGAKAPYQAYPAPVLPCPFSPLRLPNSSSVNPV